MNISRSEKEMKEHEEELRSEGDLIIFGGAYASLIHNLQICWKERKRAQDKRTKRRMTK